MTSGVTYTSFCLYNYGTIFSIGTDGSNFKLLHSFTCGTSDGGNPYDSLTLSGSTLYGMTNAYGGGSGGGSAGDGTIFSIGTDGSNFGFLHLYRQPERRKVAYGQPNPLRLHPLRMTSAGGSAGDGTIFSIGSRPLIPALIIYPLQLSPSPIGGERQCDDNSHGGHHMQHP